MSERTLEPTWAASAPAAPAEAETLSSAGVPPKPAAMDAGLACAGRYLLADELACGGMGVVFRAVDPAFGREVAIKFVQERFARDPQAVRRFMEEAQITGQLQHPGIPPVHEVGVLPDGRPFLAMKLVKGTTLADLIRESLERKSGEGANDNPTPFLPIFEQVCQAVAYAHSRGVIHRDLKPQNVMVGAFGETQVMDWGLAKLLNQEPAEPTRRTEACGAAGTTFHDPRAGSQDDETEAGAILGTPSFMPPEQAAGVIDEIDRRSDVFGLGAILCCILTGEPPHVGKGAEAVRLSAARGDLAPAFARLAGCGAEPELITLAQRCLAAKKEERPADAGEVAAAVAAIRLGAEERARRAELGRAEALVRAAEQKKRRQVWLGLAATLLAGLVAATALALWANHSRGLAESAEQKARSERDEKEKQRARAEAQEKEAKTQAALAMAVRQFLVQDLLWFAAPSKQHEAARDGSMKMDPNLRVRDLALRATRRLDGRFADQPLVEAELRLVLGSVLMELGRPDAAAVQLERFRDLELRLHGPDHNDTLTALNNLANTYYHLGRQDEAFTLRVEVLKRQSAKHGPDDPRTLLAMINLAASHAALGRLQEALDLENEALRRRRAKLGPDHPDTLTCLLNIASSYEALGRYPEALALREELLARRKATAGEDAPDTVEAKAALANSYQDAGRSREACALRAEVLKTRRVHLGPHHPETLGDLSNLASSHYYLGQLEEAHKLQTEAVALMRAHLRPDHPYTLTTMNQLGATCAKLQRHAEAQALFSEVVQRRRRLAESQPGDVGQVVSLAGACNSFGDSKREEGKPEEGLSWFAEAQRLLEEQLAKTPRQGDARLFLRNVHWNRAEAFEQLRRHAEADADWAKAVELSPSTQAKKLVAKDRDEARAKRGPTPAKE